MHPQIELYTKKVDAFIEKYPTITQLDKLKDFENKSGYPKAWFFVGFCGLIASFLLLLGGAKLIVDLLGFVYPAYMSFKSMDANNHKDNTQWLTYWVVFSFISITESVFSFIVAFIPMYYWFKIAAIIWLWHPSVRGAQTVYEQALRPLFGPLIGVGPSPSTATSNGVKKE